MRTERNNYKLLTQELHMSRRLVGTLKNWKEKVDWRNIMIHFRVLAQLPEWGYQTGFIHCSISGVSNTGDCLRRSANSSSKKSINYRHSDLFATKVHLVPSHFTEHFV
jgi:hypothetical protein